MNPTPKADQKTPAHFARYVRAISKIKKIFVNTEISPVILTFKGV
jgi:hypothetical protein